MTATHPLSGQIGPARLLVDHYCPECGMFLTSTDAPNGKRIRVRCTSKRCKGKVREIVVGAMKERRVG